MYSLLLRSCQLTGVFIIHPCLPYCWSHGKQRGLFAPRALPASSLLLTPPPPSRHFLVLPVIRLPLLPSISRPGRVGFLQLLSASLSPCCRSNPARVFRRFGQCATFHAAFAMNEGSASGVNRFEASCALLGQEMAPW